MLFVMTFFLYQALKKFKINMCLNYLLNGKSRRGSAGRIVQVSGLNYVHICLYAKHWVTFAGQGGHKPSNSPPPHPHPLRPLPHPHHPYLEGHVNTRFLGRIQAQSFAGGNIKG